MIIEFNYCIVKHGEITDTCYAFVELEGEEIQEISDELMEENSCGELTDIPNKYMKRFVDTAIKDAMEIYPNFADDAEGYAVMLQKYIPEPLLEYLPEELVDSFTPEMFDKVRVRVKRDEDCAPL